MENKGSFKIFSLELKLNNSLHKFESKVGDAEKTESVPAL